MNRSAKGLSIVTTNLDGFSLAIRRRFAKFAKLSPRQTFQLYGMLYTILPKRTNQLADYNIILYYLLSLSTVMLNGRDQ